MSKKRTIGYYPKKSTTPREQLPSLQPTAHEHRRKVEDFQARKTAIGPIGLTGQGPAQPSEAHATKTHNFAQHGPEAGVAAGKPIKREG